MSFSEIPNSNDEDNGLLLLALICSNEPYGLTPSVLGWKLDMLGFA